jgi:hypothetical protein
VKTLMKSHPKRNLVESKRDSTKLCFKIKDIDEGALLEVHQESVLTREVLH